MQRPIGRYWVIDSRCWTLGIRVMWVELISGGMMELVKAFWHVWIAVYLVWDQTFWKKMGRRPSGPYAFSGCKEWTVLKISAVDNDNCSDWISDDVRELEYVGMYSCWLVLSCVVYGCWKWLNFVWWMVSLSKVQLPTVSWKLNIRLHLRLCIVEKWNNFVFASPSFNHWIRDFNFQNYSSLYNNVLKSVITWFSKL